GRQGLALRQTPLLGEAPHVLADLHRAELRAAHGAEVSLLGRGGGQRLVVVGAGGVGVERQVELVLPAELEAGVGQRVVPRLGQRVALGEVGRVRGDLVGDDARLHVVLVRQAQVLLGGDVAQHGGAVPADHGGADAGGDVVVSGG